MTYDTGGADIKAGGVMAGMHRDKCGAAAVAGFLRVFIFFMLSFLWLKLLKLENCCMKIGILIDNYV